MQHNQRAVQAWLDTIEAKAGLNSQEQDELLRLFAEPGLPHLISLMMGARQALYAQLANQPLSSAEAVARASVIQGQIKGIDMLPETLLEMVPPAQAAPEGARD